MSRVQSVNGFFNKGYNKLKQFSTSPYTGWGHNDPTFSILPEEDWILEGLQVQGNANADEDHVTHSLTADAFEDAEVYEKGKLEFGVVYNFSKFDQVKHCYYYNGSVYGHKPDDPEDGVSEEDSRKFLGYANPQYEHIIQNTQNFKAYRETINCWKTVLTPILFPATVITLSLAVVAALITAALHLLSVIPAAAADCCLTDDEDNTQITRLN